MWDHTHRIEAKGGTFRSPNLLVAFEILDELGSRLRPLTTSTVSRNRVTTPARAGPTEFYRRAVVGGLGLWRRPPFRAVVLSLVATGDLAGRSFELGLKRGRPGASRRTRREPDALRVLLPAIHGVRPLRWRAPKTLSRMPLTRRLLHPQPTRGERRRSCGRRRLTDRGAHSCAPP